MLWIQYEATRNIAFEFIHEVVLDIANLISPYPVAAFDQGEFGLGLIVCEGDDNESTGTSSTSDCSLIGVDILSAANERSNRVGHNTLILSGTIIQGDTSVPARNSGQETTAVASGAYFTFTTTASEVVSGEGDSSPNAERGSDDLLSSGGNTDHANNENANINDQISENSAVDPTDISISEARGPPVVEVDDELIGENSDVDSVEPLARRRPPLKDPDSVSRKNGTFWGRINLLAESKGEKANLHQLDLSFDLRIESTKYNDGHFESHISIDRVGVKASQLMLEGRNKELDFSELFLVVKKVHLNVGPQGGKCLDVGQWPTQIDYLEGRSINTKRAHQLALEISPKSFVKGAWKGGIEATQTEELMPITTGVKPEYIGCGSTAGGVIWKYNVLEPFQTRLEFSERVPPVHGAILRINSSTENDAPERLVISIEAIYKPRSGFMWKRIKSRLRPKARIFADVNIASLNVLLEAKIRQVGNDCFEFPADGKSGCEVFMDMVFPVHHILNGIPKISGSTDASASLASRGC